MQKRTYYLSSCSTCKRILEETDVVAKGFALQDIKKDRITPEQLEEMRKLSGSYESLFSRRSQKFKPMGLDERDLTEEEYRDLILEEYTFLKRPVTIAGNRIFVGNDKKTVEQMKNLL